MKISKIFTINNQYRELTKNKRKSQKCAENDKITIFRKAWNYKKNYFFHIYYHYITITCKKHINQYKTIDYQEKNTSTNFRLLVSFSENGKQMRPHYSGLKN